MTYSWLPKLLAEVADIAGLDAALKLAEVRGGTEIYIPPEPGTDHWLVKAIGRDAAKAMSEAYGGTRQEVPLGPTGSIATIRRTVDRMIADGKSESEIARATGYTGRGVRKRRAKTRRSQGTLL